MWTVLQRNLSLVFRAHMSSISCQSRGKPKGIHRWRFCNHKTRTMSSLVSCTSRLPEWTVAFKPQVLNDLQSVQVQELSMHTFTVEASYFQTISELGKITNKRTLLIVGRTRYPIIRTTFISSVLLFTRHPIWFQPFWIAFQIFPFYRSPKT